MRKHLLFLLSVFLALPVAAQVQITGSAVQVGGSTASAGVSSAQGTSPIQVNGLSGTPASGDITIACPSCGQGNFRYNYTQQGTGQYVLVPFGTAGCSATGGGQSGSVNGSATNQASGFFLITGGQDGACTFSNPLLPSGVTIGQITAVYAVGWKAKTDTSPTDQPSETVHLSFTGSGISGCVPVRNGSLGGMTPTPLQYGCSIAGPFTNFSTIVAQANGATSAFQGGGMLSYVAALEVDYTGSTVTQPETVNLGPGFGWDGSNDTLSLLDFAIYPVTISSLYALPTQPANTYNLVLDGATSTDCTTGGGSDPVWCVANGSGGFTGVQFGGAVSITALTGDVNATGPGSVAATLATVNSNVGTCGDASHVGQVTLNAKGLTTGCTPVSISAGTGITSINGNNAAAQHFESTDSSITITEPDNSHIDLQAAAGAGVPFNPATTNYIFASFSGLYDDNHSLSTAIPVTSYSSTGTVVTVEATSAHGLVAGDYIDAHSMTGWPNGNQEPFLGSFQVIATGLTSTQFEFDYTGSVTTCSSSCGNTYNADYWGIYQTANQPFIKSHGTVYGFESSIVDLDTNFSSTVAPLCALTPGPNYLIIEAGQNDLSSGTIAATMETAYADVYTKAHTAGCLVIQGSIVAANYGGFPDNTIWANGMVVNEWFPLQAKSFTNTAGGAYWDQFIDYNAYLATRGVHLGDDAGAGFLFAQRTNEAIAVKNGNAPGIFPAMFQYGSGIGLDLATGYGSTNWGFFNTNGGTNPCSSTGTCNPWMVWGDTGGGAGVQLYNDSGSTSPIFQLFDATHTAYNHFEWGHDTAGLDSAVLGFNYTGAGSTSNYAGIGVGGAADYVIRFYGDGHAAFPFYNGAGTDSACFDSSGNLVRGGCGTGSLDANTVSTPLFAAGSGTANAQTVTLSPAIVSLSTGLHVRWIPSNANTSAATLAVNGLAAKNITKCGTTALVAGDLALLTVADATYDGTQFQLGNPAGTACAGGSPGVSSIDSQTGAFSFGGSGVSHIGNAYTFTGGGSGALVLLESHTASTSTSLAFTAWQSSSYDSYVLKIEHLIPTTSNDYFILRCSVDGGSTYDSGSNYSSNQFNYRSGGNSTAGSGNSATGLELGIISLGISATNPLGLTGTLNMTQASSSNYVGFEGSFSMFDGTGDNNYLGENFSGSYNPASPATCNAFEVIPSGGGHTIASGIVRIYGVVN